MYKTRSQNNEKQCKTMLEKYQTIRLTIIKTMKNNTNNARRSFLYVPQAINFANDTDDHFEQLMVSIIIMDVEEDNDKLYNDKDLLIKINNLFY